MSAGTRPPLRILLVSGLYPSPDNHVFGSFVARQHEALERLGISHRMVVNDDPRPGAARGMLKYGSLAARTVAAAFRRDYDVVLGHFLYPTAWLARIAARIGGVPYVVIAHGTDVTSVQKRGFLARASLNATLKAARVVTVSRAMERRLREEIALPDRVPVEVINMGVDRSVFRPREGARARQGWGAGERVALMAGNLIPRKAPDVALAAFAILRERAECDRLVFVGDGPMRAELESRAASLGISDFVVFAGSMQPERLADAMSAADVFVLPSRAEPLGVVLLEAMACGTPCVASRVGGIPEIVGQDCGTLVEPDDAEALARAIAQVVGLGKEAYREACLAAAARSDLDANTARLGELLSSVVSGEGR